MKGNRILSPSGSEYLKHRLNGTTGGLAVEIDADSYALELLREMHMRKYAALIIFISFAICFPVFANSDDWTYSPPGSYEQAILISKKLVK